VEAFFRFLPGRFFRRLQVSDVGLEEIGYCARACVAGDLDAATLLDLVGEVAGKNFARLAERHRRIRAELLLEAPLISPLLRHPVGCDASGHGLHDQDKTPGAMPLAIDQA